MATFRNDPYAAFNFTVTVTPQSGAQILGRFSDVTGLSTEVTYAEYREGTDANHVRKIPTLYKVGDITLKRGLIGLDLWKWLNEVRVGNPEARATVAIQMRNEAGDEVVAWELTGAYPSKWTGPTLGAKSTEVAMEELVFVARTIEIK